MSNNLTDGKRVLAILLAAGIPATLLLDAAPSFAQGVTQTPPAPNESQSMPQPPNSLPSGARTLPPGSTGMQRMGTVGTTQMQPETGDATPGQSQPGAPAQR